MITGNGTRILVLIALSFLVVPYPERWTDRREFFKQVADL